VHFSVPPTHLHLIVEAHDEVALSRGMQGLSIRMARAAHRLCGELLLLPRAAGEGRVGVHGEGGDYDLASSAPWFDGWTKPPGPVAGSPVVAAARTWVVRVGWRRHGLL
jgi:REP-associated tyrosine transposase